MVEVDDRSTPTLLPIIQRHILPETTVTSDQWKAYCCLGQSGFNHETVNHSFTVVDPQSCRCTHTRCGMYVGQGKIEAEMRQWNFRSPFQRKNICCGDNLGIFPLRTLLSIIY